MQNAQYFLDYPQGGNSSHIKFQRKNIEEQTSVQSKKIRAKALDEAYP